MMYAGYTPGTTGTGGGMGTAALTGGLSATPGAAVQIDGTTNESVNQQEINIVRTTAAAEQFTRNQMQTAPVGSMETPQHTTNYQSGYPYSIVPGTASEPGLADNMVFNNQQYADVGKGQNPSAI